MDKPSFTTEQIANMAVDSQIGTLPAGAAVLFGLTGYVLASTVAPPMFAAAIPVAATLWVLKRTPSDADLYRIEGGDASAAFKYLTPAQRVQVMQRGVAPAQLPPSQSSHDQPTPNPSPSKDGTGHNPVQDTAQSPPIPAALPNPSQPVDSRKGSESGGVGAMDRISLGKDSASTEGNRPVVGRGYQYQPGRGFVQDGLLLHQESENDWFADLFKEPWHSFVIGSTGDGKSTLVHNILHQLTKTIAYPEIVIIDPKYPFSEWGDFPVTFKGDNELLKGINAMGYQTENRLKYAKKEVEAGRPCPEFPPIIYVLDEANTAYTDHGKIVGDNIKRIVSRGRALNVWGIFIGTSCNVSDYGIAVPDLYNCHRFALKSLTALAIKRDDTLTKPEADRLLREFKDIRTESNYVALLQSEGRDRQIVTLPPPVENEQITPIPHPTESPTDHPSATPEAQSPLAVPADPWDADQPVAIPDGGAVATLIADVSDDALRQEFLKGAEYTDVLRSYGIPSDSPDAVRIHAIKTETMKALRAMCRTKGLNQTARHYGAGSGSSKMYLHIKRIWHEENPPVNVSLTGMV